MSARVTEVAPDVYRICTFFPALGIEVNQFLVRDDEPFLMHTSFRRAFPASLEGVARVIDPATLRWIGFSHFESDECGALNAWLAAAPRAQAVCSFVGATVMVDDFADRPPRALADGEVLEIGRHRLQYLATPHLPHGWDAGHFFEQRDGTLFCSDLFFHPGEPAPLSEADVIGPARDAIATGKNGPLAHDLPWTPRTEAMLHRLAALRPRTLALMHGSTYRGDGGAAIEALAGILREALAEPR